MSVDTALIFALEARSRFQKGFNASCPFPVPTYTIAPDNHNREKLVPPAHVDFIDRNHFKVSQTRFAERLLQVRLVDAANHPFTDSEVASNITNRHHLP
jgi:hypothetical protein